jgi:hypothetical protein
VQFLFNGTNLTLAHEKELPKALGLPSKGTIRYIF